MADSSNQLTPTGPSPEQLSLELAHTKAKLEFVLKHGLPMARGAQYRYHGVSLIEWHGSAEDAVAAAMADPSFLGIS